MLQTINKVATMAVSLVKKVPMLLADVKLSCETPKPSAPPSDLCKRMATIKITAKTIALSKINPP